MLLDGPDHWSNERDRPQTLRAPVRVYVLWKSCLFASFVSFTIVAGSVLGFAKAQQPQRLSVTVVSVIQAEPASRVQF